MDLISKYHTKMRRGFYAAVIISLALLMVGWWNVSMHNLGTPSDQLIVIGRLFGLLAAWCIILEIILMSRVPFMEENFDLQDMTDLHKLTGYGILLTISAHVVFLVFGYGLQAHMDIWAQFVTFNTSFEDVFLATVGTAILFSASAISVRVIRSKMRYEVWYVVHLTIYIAILLTFLHQIKTGGDFAGQFMFTAYWYTLYTLAFILWGWYRVLRPFALLVRHQLKISSVVKIALDTYMVTMTGRHIDKLYFKPGQYATWRILSSSTWTEGHPFSISSVPGDSTLSFTVKASGNFTAKIAELQPGTYVLMDGPRGSFTSDRAADSPVVTLIAGGIGITPYIAMIETLIAEGKHVTLLYAARSTKDIAFANTLKQYAATGLNIRLFLDDNGQRITEDVLTSVNSNSIVYICGPNSMSKAFSKILRKQGVDHRRIIVERFAF